MKDSPAVANYLTNMEALFRASRLGQAIDLEKAGIRAGLDNVAARIQQPHARLASNEEATRMASIFWARMRSARLFELPWEVWGSIYHAVDRWTVEKFTGKPWQPLDTSAPPPQEECDALQQLTTEEGRKIPFPDQLPFECCYFAITTPEGRNEEGGGGIRLNDGQLFVRTDPVVGSYLIRHVPMEERRLAGILMWHGEKGGDFVDIMRIKIPPPLAPNGRVGGWTTVPSWSCKEGRWLNPFSLNPWMCQILVDYIMDHKRILVERPLSSNARYDMAKSAKRMRLSRLAPRPYYTIYMKTELVQEKTQRRLGPARTFEFTYRFDVRAHECVKVQRGPIPIDPKLEKKLIKRGYRIYMAGELPVEEYARLLERKVSPKRVDEWMAIKSWVRDSFQKPANPDLPYIPAVRKPTKALRARPEDA